MRPIPSIPPVEPIANRLRMRRRSWLMSAAAVLSAPASAAVQPERSPAPASVIARELLQISPVAGFQFHEGERLSGNPWRRVEVQVFLEGSDG